MVAAHRYDDDQDSYAQGQNCNSRKRGGRLRGPHRKERRVDEGRDRHPHEGERRVPSREGLHGDDAQRASPCDRGAQWRRDGRRQGDGVSGEGPLLDEGGLAGSLCNPRRSPTRVAPGGEDEGHEALPGGAGGTHAEDSGGGVLRPEGAGEGLVFAAVRHGDWDPEGHVRHVRRRPREGERRGVEVPEGVRGPHRSSGEVHQRSQAGDRVKAGGVRGEGPGTLGATMEQKDTDETIFSSTREQCKMKSDEWDERGRLRTEQLSGINKALEILTSDSARDTFQSATGNRVVDNFGSEGVDVDFLQVAQKKDPREKAFLVLKQMSRGTSNLRLARLAAAVRTTATGHFDEVISKIDDMDAKLKQEGLDDVIQRDWCIKEQHFNEDLKSRKEYDISQLEAKILRTEEAKANMLKKQDRTREQLKELQDMWKQAGEDRVAESAEYTNAKNDDTMAISLLADAIAAFSAYGENNAVLLQVKKSTKKQPVFEVSEDQAPDATFSGKDNHKGAQDAVVSMMTQIKENLENEVALADKAEEKALVDHANLETEVEKQEDQYDKYIIELDNLMAEATSEIERLTGDKTKTEEEKTTTEEYLAEIKPNCEWIKGAFTLRANARDKEHKGLLEAKAILAGAVFVQEDQTMGFLQKVQ